MEFEKKVVLAVSDNANNIKTHQIYYSLNLWDVFNIL